MGAKNVKAVYERWGALDHAPFRLLVYMAVTSMDEDDPPRFFGGREALAAAAGAVDLPPEPPVDDPEAELPPDWVAALAVLDQQAAAQKARRARRDAFRKVERLVGVLREKGAIEQLRPAGAGKLRLNAEYALRWPTLSGPMANAERGASAEMANAERSNGQRSRAAMANADVGPKEKEEKKGAAAPHPFEPDWTTQGRTCRLCEFPETNSKRHGARRASRAKVASAA